MYHKYELTDEEITDFALGKPISKIVYDVAVRVGYHPLGYGIWNERIINPTGIYYATWHSSKSCD